MPNDSPRHPPPPHSRWRWLRPRRPGFALAWLWILAGCGGGSGAPDAAATAPAATAAPATANLSSAGHRSELAFSFVLPAERTTSAGVYDDQGHLVRTLWRGERLPAGPVVRRWDQQGDDGRDVPDGRYTVKVIHHDVRHVWEGVIGNTSSAAPGGAPRRSFLAPTSLAADGARLHYAVGYNEFQSGLHAIDRDAPQTDLSPIALVDPFIAATQIATDGQRLYLSNGGGLAGKSFIAAFEVQGGAQSIFAAGQPVCLNWLDVGMRGCHPGQDYRSVLELRNDLASPPTGLAVQKNGLLLAVAYGGDQQVHLLDKRSGALRAVLPVPLIAGASNQIAFAPDGDLWVITPQAARRYSGLPSAPILAATTAPLLAPRAIAVDPGDDDGVWIADGGARQQLLRHDRNGTLRQTLGRAGGHAGRAAVADDRLCFTLAAAQEQTALAVDAEHAVWVVDTCNNRLLRFLADGRVDTRIAYLPGVYAATVDGTAPSRVFANFLEYAVDYTVPLSDPRAWTLVRNWLPALPASLVDADSGNRAFGGLRNVQTLRNGRTYAQLMVNGRPWLAELTADGQVRASMPLPSPAAGDSSPVLYPDGALRYAHTEAGRQTVLVRALNHFDGAADPVWAAPVAIASASIDADAPVCRNGTFTGLLGPRFPTTASGAVVFFNPGIEADSGFHLGAVPQGGSAWAWKASPSGALDGRGTFQTRRDDPSIQYGGNAVMASGRSIVYGYHGEFYRDLGNRNVGQANQFMHFRDDGLFIGQFGVPSTRAVDTAQAGLSGNAFSPTLVRVGAATYLYHNDEFFHGGVHRWRLDGLDDVQELSASAGLGSTIELR